MRIGFIYELCCYDTLGSLRWSRKQTNLIPNEGRDYMLYAALKGGIQYYPWYIGLYEAPYSPTYDETMSSLLNSCIEIDTYAISDNKRILLEADFSTNGVWSNYLNAARVVFTDSKLVQGIFITSASARGNDNGLLLSVARLDSPEVVNIGESLTVVAGTIFLT